ncbi:MAG: DUF4282 domain-containing protein [Caulobacteraceae bacterium]
MNFWDLLTFERRLTGPVVHIIYWCGLAGIALIGFAAVGAAVGLSIRGEGMEKLIALPALVVGALVVLGLALLWRAMCEFFVAVFRISDDLHALRQSQNID